MEEKVRTVKNKKNTMRRSLMVFFALLSVVALTGIFAHFLGEKSVSAQTYTVDYGDYQVLYTQGGELIYTMYQDKEANTITLEGTHNYSTMSDYISYSTTGFTMSNQSTPSGNGVTTGISSVNRKTISTSANSYGNAGERYTMYTFSAKTFVENLQSLFSNSQLTSDRGVTLYLSSIYNVGMKHVDAYGNITWDSWIRTGIVDLPVMQDAAAWTATTRDEVLPRYYDMKFTIRLQGYTTTVNYVYLDEDGKTKIISSNTGTIEDCVVNGDYSYTLPSSDLSITSGGKSYTYDNQAYIVYNDGTKKNLYSGPTVSWTHTQSENAVINYYFVEDESSEPIDVALEFYTKLGNEDYVLQKTVDYTNRTGIQVYVKDEFSYSVASSVTFSGVKYYYETKWSYTYEDPAYGSMNSGSKSGEPYIKYAPAVADGTVLHIKMYFSADEPVVTDPVPTITPADMEPIPAKEFITLDVTKGTSTGTINSNVYNNNLYASFASIPTQESQYAQITTSFYLIGYSLEKMVGEEIYKVLVSQDYTLQWMVDTGEVDEDTGDPILEMTEETVTLETTIEVQRAYGYWEINSFKFYTVSSGTLYNSTLPAGSATVTPASSYYTGVPYVSTNDTAVNYARPDEVTSGIVMDPVTITSGTQEKPDLPQEAFEVGAYDAAQAGTGEIKVWNDYIVFNGVPVMNNTKLEYDTGSLNMSFAHADWYTTRDDMLYSAGYIIPAEKKNGTYTSSGTVTYTATGASINPGQTTLSYSLNSVNSVIVHTPVYCDAVVSADNDEFVQLAPDEIDASATQLVLDEENELNDFTIKISNTGAHLQTTGYYTRDYSYIKRTTSLSNILADPATGLLHNEVQFSFDCYIDVYNDDNMANDVYLPAGTWVVFGRNTQRFYIGMTVAEGMYYANYRTIAINAASPYTAAASTANLSRSEYVATDYTTFQVSGRMFGLSLYDITDYPIWEEAFRVPDTLWFKKDLAGYTSGVNTLTYDADSVYDYTVGINDSYGDYTGRMAKFTLPLVSGSHPYYTNMGILKKGYSVRFTLDTVGSYYMDGSKVEVTPTFWWVDENGQNRTQVDVYYKALLEDQTVPLIRTGGKLDLINYIKILTGNRYLGIPEAELRNTAAIRGVTYAKWRSQYTDMMCVSKVLLTSPFRTYTNQDYYAEQSTYGFVDDLAAENITQNTVSSLKQSWYGMLYIPNTATFCVKDTDVYTYANHYGIDYTEDFWLHGGYIIVNIEIKVTDRNGEQTLYYVDPGSGDSYCSMWEMEGALGSKTGKDGVTFDFEPGDFIIYYTDKSYNDDYTVNGIY